MGAVDELFATFTGAGMEGATTQWPAVLGNGWCQYIALPGVAGGAVLAFACSTDGGSTYVAGPGIAAPAAAACAAQLAPPIASPPCGTAAVGPVLVTLSATDPNVTLTYATGASLTTYAGPFLIAAPGATTVTAIAQRDGALSSAPLSCSYSVAVSTNAAVTGLSATLLSGQ